MAYNGTNNRQRVFIGVPIDKYLQNAIEKLLTPLRHQHRNLRWVPAENRHLTLAFLGDVSDHGVVSLKKAFDQVYPLHLAFSFEFSALDRFPNNRGRIIALTAQSSDSMDRLVRATRDMVRGCGFRFEDKKFRPHVTLARIPRARQQLGGFGRQVQVELDVSRVLLYRSTLASTGSVYSVLRTAALPGKD